MTLGVRDFLRNLCTERTRSIAIVMSYVPLWCKSNFSFLEGASHPDELIEEAYRQGLPALALTDGTESTASSALT